MHVYKLINLCTCVCRSYTSGCRQNAEEEEKKRGRERRGKERGVEIKRGLEEGFGGKEGKGGRKEERGRRKHMDLFKNTTIPESGPFRKSVLQK